MTQTKLLADLIATIVYPGLAAISLLWVHICLARWMQTRSLIDILLLLMAIFATATFLLLSLSTGVFALLSFDRLRLAIRLGLLIILIFAIWFTVKYLRRQHADYQKRR